MLSSPTAYKKGHPLSVQEMPIKARSHAIMQAPIRAAKLEVAFQNVKATYSFSQVGEVQISKLSFGANAGIQIIRVLHQIQNRYIPHLFEKGYRTRRTEILSLAFKAIIPR